MTAAAPAGSAPSPIIVVGSAHSGVGLLRQALAAHPSVTWIDAPGFVQLGHQMARIWGRVEGRPGSTSGLARTGIGALLRNMLLTRLAGDGTMTWAATTVPSPRAGLDFFAAMFPAVKFVCLHRRCDEVIGAVMSAHPWGIAGEATGFDSFLMMHPWSPAAAIAEYWLAQTSVLAAFEADHPSRCLRLHYGDLLIAPADTAASIASLTGTGIRLANGWGEASAQRGASLARDGPLAPERIPAELLARVNGLMADLEYPRPENTRHGTKPA